MDLIESINKIQFKIDAIQSKINEEKIFLYGAQRMALSADIRSKILESEGKIHCLNKALLKYRGLAVIDKDMKEIGFMNKQKLLSGRITMTLLSCLDLIGKRIANSDIFMVVKVDGIRKAQSSCSKGKWDEEITFDVDNASELELLIRERDGGVLAMIWFSFRMLIDDITNFYNNSGILSRAVDNTQTKTISLPSGILSRGQDDLESVFELEPAGNLHLKIRISILPLLIKIDSSFSSTHNMDQNLSRQRPVQKIIMKRGHMFLQKRFYQIKKCAVCREFLLGGKGYCCESIFKNNLIVRL